MIAPRISATQARRRLESCRADYEHLKARIAEIGFTCEGSLVQRYTRCNNTSCRCVDPNQRHGPYWQLSWKQQGRTVSRMLSADEAALYQEWIDNRRRLESLLEQMKDLSRTAAEYITADAGYPLHGPARPRRRAEP